MSAAEFGQFVLTIAVLLGAVHGLGYLAERLKQPRIVGEILAGILVGPFVLKLVAPATFHQVFAFSSSSETVLGFLYQLGLILLMFCSGAETRRLLASENRNKTILLIAISDIGSFVLVLGLGFFGLIPLARLTGPLGRPSATLLIVAIAVSVTSIPVISRIFWDLGIMRTRFVSLLLGYAVLEDIALWVVLAFAMALAKTGSVAGQHLGGTVASHVISTFAYMIAAMIFMPMVLRWLSRARWNVLNNASPVGYIVLVLLAYCAIAAVFDVNLQFAALLAGYGVVGGIRGTERERVAEPVGAIAKVSFGVFVPIYFGLVGYKLVFGREFSWAVLLVFLFASSAIAIATKALAARAGGFRGLDMTNIAITCNARGGPGIVLASVAYEAKLINAAFYTALVLTAVLTSQACGAWLRYVLGKGLPLLSSNPEETWPLPTEPTALPNVPQEQAA
jgi:Kef-type K+ transport system membrane component KefB